MYQHYLLISDSESLTVKKRVRITWTIKRMDYDWINVSF